FFFSSRRRHTRSKRDWSSDVCSSDLIVTASSGTELAHVAAVAARSGVEGLEWMATVPGTVGGAVHGNAGAFGSETADVLVDAERSEERRVGKEWRAWGVRWR